MFADIKAGEKTVKPILSLLKMLRTAILNYPNVKNDLLHINISHYFILYNC